MSPATRKPILLSAATCFALLSIPVQASPRDLLVATWTRFIEQCTPLLEDPVAVRDSLTFSALTTELSRTTDGRIVFYTSPLDNSTYQFALYFEQFGSKIDADCTLSREGVEVQYDTAVLKEALEGLLAATPGLEYGGGEWVCQTRSGGGPSGYFLYIVDGAFPGRRAFLSIGIYEGSLEFEVHLDYPTEDQSN